MGCVAGEARQGAGGGLVPRDTHECVQCEGAAGGCVDSQAEMGAGGEVRRVRRCHRGERAARRHARERRRTRRCEAAWRQLEESRSTALAAPPSPPSITAASASLGGERNDVDPVWACEAASDGAREARTAALAGLTRREPNDVVPVQAERERGAALLLQRAWRQGARGTVASTSIERGWRGPRARRLGSLDAHVRFLQYVFRRTRQLRPGCWRRGGLRGLMAALRWTRAHRCGGLMAAANAMAAAQVASPA